MSSTRRRLSLIPEEDGLLDLDPIRFSERLLDLFRGLRFMAREAAYDGTDIVHLLKGLAWRRHLLGAAAVLIRDRSPEEPTVCEAIWKAIDRGSWVGPQLVAVVSIVDPHFESEARARITSRLHLTAARYAEIQDEVGTYDASVEDHERSYRRPSTYAALAELLKSRQGSQDWIGSVLAEPEAQEFLASDRDHGARIPTEWLSQFSRRRKILESAAPPGMLINRLSRWAPQLPVLHRRALPGDRGLQILRGDVLRERSDALICPADAVLAPSSPLSRGIATRLQPYYEAWSRRSVESVGPLVPGEPRLLLTEPSGEPWFKGILHVLVSPGITLANLQSTVEASLLRASDLGWLTLSMPSFGGAPEGMGPREGVRILLEAIERFFEEHPDSPVVLIRILVDSEDVGTFS